MSAEANKFWNDLAGEYRRSMGLNPLTAREVEQELASVEPQPLSDEDIEAIVDAVVNDDIEAAWVPPEPAAAFDSTEVQDDVFQLNRNKGLSDPETDSRIDGHRKKALEDDENTDDEDETGLAGGGSTPRKSG